MSTTKQKDTAIVPVDAAGELAGLFDGLPDFSAPEYRDTTAQLPRLTPIRDNGSGVFGFFVKAEDAAAVSLSVDFDPTEVKYEDGSTSIGYMFTSNFGLCLQPVTPLLAIDRKASQDLKKLVAEEYESRHRDDDRYTAGVVYHVLLTDGKGELLHEEPLQLLVKGATSATFNKVWKEAVAATTRLYLNLKGKPYTPLNWEFNRLVVFQPILAVELAGTKQKSKALVVKDFVAPTKDSIGQFLAIKDYPKVANVLHPMENATLMPEISAADDAVLF